MSAATGFFRTTLYDSTGVAIWSAQQIGAIAWNPVAGTEYEILCTLDTATRRVQVFVNGTYQGTISGAVMTRTNTATRLMVGAGVVYFSADGRFDDVAIYDTVLTTVNYAPFAYGLSDPKQPTFYAGYDEDINGDWGGGVLTGTAVGGASVSGGKLDLTYGDIRYVEYASAGNSVGLQTGCVRFKVTPNYSGTPASSQSFCNIIEIAGSNNNRIAIGHASGTGNLFTFMFDNAGVSIAAINWGVWNPTLGTEYEIEAAWGLNGGGHRIFVDGTQFGTTDLTTGTRVAQTAIRVGTNQSATATSNFAINDIIFFEYPQHLVNYTPSWTGILPYEYYGDVVTLPSFTYSGALTMTAWTNFVVTESNAPRYIMNNLYWTGAAWAATSNTWATANPAATVLANLATLPNAATMTVKVVTNNNIATQMSIGDLTLTYTGQIYDITGQSVVIDTALNPTLLTGVAAYNSFTATVSETGSDTVTFALSSDDGVNYRYWNGLTWAISAGVAQSNQQAIINTNIGTFPITGEGIKVRVYLNSATGATTPNIGHLIINYLDTGYVITNPTIKPEETFGADTLSGFTATVTEPGTDQVTFVIEVDGNKYYWNGSAWAVSSGYAQSNTASTINTNIASLSLPAGAGVRPVIYLHSGLGTTTPTITSLVITYNYAVDTGTYDFGDRDDYTYDRNKLVIVGGKAALDDNVPEDGNFYSPFATTLNEVWNGLPGVATGGAAILGGYIDLAHADVRYVTYTFPFGAIRSPNYGTVRAIIKPNYSGSPATQQFYAVSSYSAGSNVNSMIFAHKTNGNLNMTVYDSAGIVRINQDLGVWAPVAGTDYEILFVYNFTAGDSKLFVDGTQFGSTITTTLSRDTNISIIRLGSSVSGGQSSNFMVKKFAVFSRKLYNANYTAGENYSYPVYRYATDNPTIIPTTTFSTDSITGFSATETVTGSDEIRYTIEVDGIQKYWDGAAWSNCLLGYTNANSAAAINANIATYDLSAGYDVRPVAYFHSDTGGTTPSLAEIVFTYSIFNPADVPPSECTVSGYILDAMGNPVSGVTVTATPVTIYQVDGKDFSIWPTAITATTNASGYWEMDLIRSDQFVDDTALYNFTFSSGTTSYTMKYKTIPAQSYVDFKDL
jgi:hypothetical protein